MSNFLISITRTSEIFSSVEINISAGGFNAEWIVVSYKEMKTTRKYGPSLGIISNILNVFLLSLSLATLMILLH